MSTFNIWSVKKLFGPAHSKLFQPVNPINLSPYNQLLARSLPAFAINCFFLSGFTYIPYFQLGLLYTKPILALSCGFTLN